jgi:hypothetical protein
MLLVVMAKPSVRQGIGASADIRSDIEAYSQNVRSRFFPY